MTGCAILMLAGVIRIPINDTLTLLIPEDNRFTLSISVEISETLWVDSTRWVYRYTVVNDPQSAQNVRFLGLGGASPLWRSAGIIDTIFIHTPEKIYPPDLSSKTSTWILQNFLPGDTLRVTLLSSGPPDLVYWDALGEDSIATPSLVGGNVGEGDSLFQVADSIVNEVYFGQTPLGAGRYGYTVGPGPLPPPYLDSMVIHLQIRNDTALAIGWMSERAHDRLARFLQQALRWAREENRSRLRATLERFLSTLERLHNQGHVQDEAFYVLYYRARYILNRIPFPEGPPRR